MNEKDYEIIKVHFGIKFIQYVINYNSEFNKQTKFQELKLDDNQIEALTCLHNIQKNCWQLPINERNPIGVFESQITQIEPSTFNNLRRSCDGDFPKIEKGDPVFEFLSDLMIQSYPHLLRKYKYTNMMTRMQFPFFAPSIFRLINKSESFLKQDILNALTNKRDKHYLFQFNLSNGFEIYQQASRFSSTIISRAFQNSCNQMNYTLENCLNELKFLLKSLRELAEGKTTEISYFIGLKGISFKESIEIDNFSIRPLDSIDNPGLHTQYIFTPSQNELFGAIACIKIPVKVVGQQKEKTSVGSIMPKPKEVSELMKKINLSLFFSESSRDDLHENKGIIQGFEDNGFALSENSSFGLDTCRGRHVLENRNFDLFKSWLKELNNPKYKKFQIAFDRLILILTKRIDPVDAIIDGVIAWESLFGDRENIMLKVCGSISKLLDPKNERNLYKQLKKIYDDRSRIVHGNKSPFDNLSKAEETKKFICDVTRDCLIKIIDERQDLIPLTSQERYKKLLPNIEKKESSKRRFCLF